MTAAIRYDEDTRGLVVANSRDDESSRLGRRIVF
jgi:hypothetical protein